MDQLAFVPRGPSRKLMLLPPPLPSQLSYHMYKTRQVSVWIGTNTSWSNWWGTSSSKDVLLGLVNRGNSRKELHQFVLSQ